MKSTPFRHIEYSWTDTLNRKELKNGERLEVKWPDGSVEHVEVTLVGQTSTDLEMNGHYDTHTSYHAAYVIKYHGVEVSVPLSGLLARRLAAPRLRKNGAKR